MIFNTRSNLICKLRQHKGFWLVNSIGTNPEGFTEYAKPIVTWINSVDNRIIAKDLKSNIREGIGGHLGVII